MPNRIIKESICYSDDIDQLTWFEEVVFYRLLVRADDNGRLDARLPFLCSLLFATRDDVTCKMIDDALTVLHQFQLIYRYLVDNRPYLLMTKWEVHQRVRHVRGKYPLPVFDCQTEEGKRDAMLFLQLTEQSVPWDLPPASNADLASASDLASISALDKTSDLDLSSDLDKDLDMDTDKDTDKDIGGNLRRDAASKQSQAMDNQLRMTHYLRQIDRAQYLGEAPPKPPKFVID